MDRSAFTHEEAAFGVNSGGVEAHITSNNYETKSGQWRMGGWRKLSCTLDLPLTDAFLCPPIGHQKVF